MGRAMDADTLGEHLENDRLLGFLAGWIHQGYLFVDEDEIE